MGNKQKRIKRHGQKIMNEWDDIDANEWKCELMEILDDPDYEETPIMVDDMRVYAPIEMHEDTVVATLVRGLFMYLLKPILAELEETNNDN